jgi:hypothetical protein
MAQLRPAKALGVFVVAALAGILWAALAPRGTETTSRAEPATGDTVQLVLSISSPEHGLSLEATRKLPRGSSVLEALQSTVAMETKEYAGIGIFVTKLCGIAPPEGKFWSAAVDGKKSPVGIAAIKLDRDLRLDWTIKDIE